MTDRPTAAPTWSLIDEPWIPVLQADGPAEVSIRHALHHAHEIVGLAATPATVNVAILRQVLLPVVLDAFQHPRSTGEWAERLAAGRFDPAAVDDYLGEHQHRFDLLHPAEPFGQVADLATAKGEVKPPSLLVPSAATGNNVPLFSPRSEADRVTFTPAEGARWLLHAQCYDTAAIKSGAVGDGKAKAGKTAGNPTGPTGRFASVVPSGTTLFETLLLNLPIRSDKPPAADRPWWRRDAPTPEWTSRPASGLLDMLTWQSRRVRYHWSVEGDGPATIGGVVLCAGDRLAPFPVDDPHAAWRIEAKPKPGDQPRRPQGVRSGRAAWRGLESLLAVPDELRAEEPDRVTSDLLEQVGKLRGAEHLSATFPLRVEVTGIEYGNMSAVVENLVHDAIPMPTAALLTDDAARPTVLRFATDVDRVVALVDGLERDVRRSLGGEPLPWDKGQRASTRLIQAIDPLVRRLLEQLRHAPDSYAAIEEEWVAQVRELAHDTADEVLADLPPAAFRGRGEPGKAINASTAERWFRIGLHSLLGPAADPHDLTTDTQEAMA